jgi:hypothetical protein
MILPNDPNKLLKTLKTERKTNLSPSVEPDLFSEEPERGRNVAERNEPTEGLSSLATGG